eukprot:gene3261-4038_t
MDGVSIGAPSTVGCADDASKTVITPLHSPSPAQFTSNSSASSALPLFEPIDPVHDLEMGSDKCSTGALLVPEHVMDDDETKTSVEGSKEDNDNAEEHDASLITPSITGMPMGSYNSVPTAPLRADLPVSRILCGECNIERPTTASHCYDCGVCVDE